MKTLCEHLDWDSRFFGERVARVKPTSPTPAQWTAIMEWCGLESVDCLYFLTDIAETAALAQAVARNFAMVDLRLTLDCQVCATKWPAELRNAVPADIPALQAMVRGAYPQSRFARDPRFTLHADRLYEVWIQRNAEGFADQVLVATDDSGQLAGFVSCHKRSANTGELGLTAVRADVRGTGIGAKLVEGALAWFSENRIPTAFVVTNGGNIAAQRLYQRHGFFTRKIEIWFHRWFEKN